MARKIEDIKQQIITAKQNKPELAELSSDSKSSIWGLWAYITAYAINIFENFLDIFKNDVTNYVDQRTYGTGQWYVNKLLKYQDGEPIDPVTLQYENDTNDSIIKVASYKEQLNIDNKMELFLYFAGIDENDEFYGFNDPNNDTHRNQYHSICSYIEMIKIAGIKVNKLSNDPDKLRIGGVEAGTNGDDSLMAKVYYDGLYDIDDIKDKVNEAIKQYLLNVPAEGVIVKNALIDAIQKIEGVKDFYIPEDELVLTNGIDELDQIIIKRAEPTFTGYAKIDPMYPLEDTIKYIISKY
jgi:hypothetical protein